MIDDFAIIVSTIMVLYVLVRAAALDRSIPWFEADTAPTEPRGVDGANPTNEAPTSRSGDGRSAGNVNG